jgi:hypothetical protein
LEKQQEGSISSAEVVVPIVLSLFPLSSAVDLGCGVGGWLRAFERLGVDDYLGIDGDYVPRGMLKIPKNKFIARDLKSLTLSDIAAALTWPAHWRLPSICQSAAPSNLYQFWLKLRRSSFFRQPYQGKGGLNI